MISLSFLMFLCCSRHVSLSLYIICTRVHIHTYIYIYVYTLYHGIRLMYSHIVNW